MNNVVITPWYTRCIINVIDLFNSDGGLLTIDELRNMYGIRGTFLDLQRMIAIIPIDWKNKITLAGREIGKYKYNLQTNPYIRQLIRYRKGSKIFYNILTDCDKSISSVPRKWVQRLGNISNEEFSAYSSNLNIIQEIKMRDFQFKINQNILTTRSFQYVINKCDTNLCSYCNQ